MHTSKKSQYLANFMVGVGSVLNIAPIFSTSVQIKPASTDFENLQKDWYAVGQYFTTAIKKVKNDERQTKFK
ncbi:hypothetical protein A6A19_01585 [Actinobacillus delphinicola]|uniref:Uncharacterized protein n=1 Tax=Actinobacillus delphinicola TaxID=51161 RepID=A0A448TW50_9PAST|nr:hypothetical protein [Actinobacillus delphinicola]MDG6896718.1 hypothetical protein [Actinobacillus delphinicola]VEJ10150.1 Uncharacterised protein [Actinobacillus delphinicola]